MSRPHRTDPGDLLRAGGFPNDTYAYMQEKACDWIRHGTRMVVVVEPERRRVIIHRSDTEVQILGEDGVVDGGDVVPGFQLPVRELFA